MTETTAVMYCSVPLRRLRLQRGLPAPAIAQGIKELKMVTS